MGTDIAAPPYEVWRVVTDIGVLPRFSAELQRVEWAAGFDGPALGAQFLGTNRNPAVGEWTTRCEIVEFEPDRVFAYAVERVEKPVATWRFELSPSAEGTYLSYTAVIGPGRSGLTMLIERDPEHEAEIVADRLEQFRAGMTATLEGIRDLAAG